MMTTIILILVVGFGLGLGIYAFLANRQNSKRYIPQPLNSYPHYTMTEDDLKLIRLINEYRKSLNLDFLIENQHLSDVSYSHSLYMVKKGSPSHDFAVNREAEFPDRLLGEIIAYNYSTPQSTLTGWINSPKHNKVLLNIEYKFIGLSFAIDALGKKYVCALLLS